eukprot:620400-Prorocentrum_minimum.AAC.1
MSRFFTDAVPTPCPAGERLNKGLMAAYTPYTCPDSLRTPYPPRVQRASGLTRAHGQLVADLRLQTFEETADLVVVEERVSFVGVFVVILLLVTHVITFLQFTGPPVPITARVRSTPQSLLVVTHVFVVVGLRAFSPGEHTSRDEVHEVVTNNSGVLDPAP